ncbi:DUF2336 domain-containing protein [Sphingomonas piscis]|uniref:DUF2336 domain-containing protein n=1 Tax=Sphingomonas piscis TaxID=2714943 RepID=A0A6G7YSP6_9SPHN|nr:DUF2336 domain-containing protein [Sphingomonas piscis]QIK79766.1 DUF2336 domain-containing protein [Sphingomonas piscis]
MTPEEWPIWAPPPKGSMHPALPAGADRLTTVRQDFFLEPDFRLKEQQIATMTALLHRLVSDVATEIQAVLPRDWLPANEDHEGLVQRLKRAGLLDITELVELLLRRADEERVQSAAQLRDGGRARNLVQPLVADPQPEIAAAAMAALIARGRRRDRYGRAVIELDDLSAKAAAELVFAIAAGLRERLPVTVDAASAERQLGSAATERLGSHDDSRALDASTARLADALRHAARITDSLLDDAIQQGDIGLLSHLLAARARVDHRLIFQELTSCQNRRVLMLLRIAGVSRSVAATFLAQIGDLVGLPSAAASLEHFESWSDEQLHGVRTWWQLDDGFQRALSKLGNGNGHRAA